MRTRAILLVLAALATACGHRVLLRDQSGLIPWIDTVPTPQPDRYAEPPAGGAPACTAADLDVSISTDGAAGNLAAEIGFKNTSAKGCTVSGRPRVAIFDARGAEIPVAISNDSAQFAGPAPPGWPNVFLRRGDDAAAAALMSSWCTPRQPARWTIRLPSIDSTFEVAETGTPPCYGRELSRSNKPSISVRPIQPEPLDSPAIPYPFKAEILAPQMAAEGKPLRYSVTLTNISQAPYRFSRCPSYVENLVGSGNKAAARYVLNCSPVGEIAPGADVTFAMELRDWFAATNGPAALYWGLEGEETIHVPIVVTGA